ncbi:ATP-dependent Clp protease proteolytic subunit [Staphylococcus aureus]
MIYTHVYLSNRIIMLGSQIDDNVANSIVSQLLFLQAQDESKDIYLYIIYQVEVYSWFCYL